MLVDDDALRVTAESAWRGAVLVRRSVGQCEVWAVLLLSPSRQFGHVRSESTIQPTPTTSPTVNLVTPGPTSTIRPMILVPWHARVDRRHHIRPLVPGVVQVRMADSAILDLDFHIFGGQFATLDRYRREKPALWPTPLRKL